MHTETQKSGWALETPGEDEAVPAAEVGQAASRGGVERHHAAHHGPDGLVFDLAQLGRWVVLPLAIRKQLRKAWECKGCVLIEVIGELPV